MANITIRNIDESLKQRLRIKAAKRGHSIEEEAHNILRQAVEGITGPDLLTRSIELFGKAHGVELDLPSRADEREPPRFSRIFGHTQHQRL